ncbi:unnamed protein product [Rotaria sp. Silwood2]|nr:unnamed protein product [Rotaria sp. Silwood2]
MGKLFILNMLNSKYTYKIIEYLFRNKTDEEHLECLWSLLCMIGQKLDAKSAEKPVQKLKMYRYYSDLDNIVKEQKTSARICRMIRDLIELRQTGWVGHCVETESTTANELHEQDFEQKQHNIDNAFSGSSQQQYNDERDSCSSGIEQKTDRNEDDVDNSFNADTLTQLYSNDKEYQELLAINLAGQHSWAKELFIEKKSE